MELYNYKATVVRVVDGDTVKLDIDLGFRMHWTSNCRIAGVNAPEMGSEKGEAAKEFLKELLPVGRVLEIESKQLDKYGRPIIDSVLRLAANQISLLSEYIISKGHAVKY